MNATQAKQDLPDVWVKMPNGKYYVGDTSGRRNELALVGINYDGKLHSAGPPLRVYFHASWADIAKAAIVDGQRTIEPLEYTETVV
jgi:hypothetical protein